MIVNPSLSVLVVDDEIPIRFFLRVALAQDYAVFEAETGTQALQLVERLKPDIILLDLSLPDMDGLEFTRRLREWSLVPVIIISVRNSEMDMVTALDAGADDYLPKPFSAGELMARLRAARRHCASYENEPVYKSGALTVNLEAREVLLDKQRVSLTPTEFDLLRSLVIHSGMVLTHQQLIQTVWNGNMESGSNLLRVNISNLRKKIEKNPLRPCYILTEPGVGYRLNVVEDIK